MHEHGWSDSLQRWVRTIWHQVPCKEEEDNGICIADYEEYVCKNPTTNLVGGITVTGPCIMGDEHEGPCLV